MKKVLFIILGMLLVINCLNSSNDDDDNSILDNIIDHENTDLDSFTDTQIAEAATLDIYVEHASVGNNIRNGLASLETDDSKYNDSNLNFYSRGNPGARAKFDEFNTRVTDNTDANYANPADYDAMMLKLCYVDNVHNGFASVTEMFNYYRDMMNALQRAYPNTLFIWWTIPIQETGNQDRDTYNSLIRNYCENNDKILFDIADIESHSSSGEALFDTNSYEIMDDSYSDDGGHLNTTGQRVVASAFWALLCRIYTAQ